MYVVHALFKKKNYQIADEIYARCSLVIEQNNLKKLLYSLRVQHLEQF